MIDALFTALFGNFLFEEWDYAFGEFGSPTLDIDHGVEEFGGGGGIGDEVYYQVVEESEASCDVNRVQVDRVYQPFSLIEQIILIDALRQSFIRAFSNIRMT